MEGIVPWRLAGRNRAIRSVHCRGAPDHGRPTHDDRFAGPASASQPAQSVL